MQGPEGTNQKLVTILRAVTKELEKINSTAWYLSGESKDTCGVIDPFAIPDWSDEGLIKEIERRELQINERKRYIAGLNGGADGHRRTTDTQADAIYQRYCGKN
ncbi:hypothetical protein MPK66_gp025 [Erwinia phage pEa_SNUABM_2]|uniref:Uncharacterized protein n=1 Tax=Erwinia phage pEa_SNUABM_2 TaxID=2869547 RepID=A0AAE7XQE9_9CAUD|nr:hypothetical protein MPK66_gp025 [Erwinia phage pEa_SNUABM_2]QZE59269.1 hypothetical protein pEaSNUABM2_00025 [Erwinia phage pEa_SNUABM_2]QZE59605.1 hypothetical protein pEaSNUABM39_00025 [Erwinia phage pEa_SNUABM_39]